MIAFSTRKIEDQRIDLIFQKTIKLWNSKMA